MFGNLKDKLGGVADLKKYAAPQNLANSLMGSRQRSGTQTPSVPASPAVPLNQNSRSAEFNSHYSGQQQHANGRRNVPNQLPSISHSPLSAASSRSHSREASITSLPLSPGFSPTPSVDGRESMNRNANPASPTSPTFPPTPSKHQVSCNEFV